MREIEVGEYVRLTSGIIDKIIEIKTVSTQQFESIEYKI